MGIDVERYFYPVRREFRERGYADVDFVADAGRFHHNLVRMLGQQRSAQMGNHVPAIVAVGVSLVSSGQEKRQGRPPAVFVTNFSVLLLVYGFFQFGPRGKLRDLTGSDFNSGASLWIAPVPRLSLRYRESAETYQSHPIPFS